MAAHDICDQVAELRDAQIMALRQQVADLRAALEGVTTLCETGALHGAGEVHHARRVLSATQPQEVQA